MTVFCAHLERHGKAARRRVLYTSRLPNQHTCGVLEGGIQEAIGGPRCGGFGWCGRAEHVPCARYRPSTASSSIEPSAVPHTKRIRVLLRPNCLAITCLVRKVYTVSYTAALLRYTLPSLSQERACPKTKRRILQVAVKFIIRCLRCTEEECWVPVTIPLVAVPAPG
jgi:hypothetical protein